MTDIQTRIILLTDLISFTVEGPQNSRNISGLQNKCYASMVFFMHEIKYFEFDMSVEYSCYNSYFGSWFSVSSPWFHSFGSSFSLLASLFK
jgi:hypothetical protein